MNQKPMTPDVMEMLTTHMQGQMARNTEIIRRLERIEKANDRMISQINAAEGHIKEIGHTLNSTGFMDLRYGQDG